LKYGRFPILFYLGDPDRKGGLVLQEVQVRGGGVKKTTTTVAGVVLFWNNPWL